MRNIKHWFSIGPYNEYEGYQYHWFNARYEYNGTRIRLIVGDLSAESEDETGCKAGPQFEIAIHLAQEDIPEFHLPDNPNARYDIHSFTAILWRWGVYLSVRGKAEVPAS